MTTTSTLSRRTLVTSAAALPALAVPAVASAAPARASTTLPPDLIEQFERVRAWYLDNRKREELWREEFYRRFRAVTGLTEEQYRAIVRDDPRWEETHAAWKKLYAEFPGEDDEEECNRLCDERWDVAKALMNHKPQTFADLAWQAEAYLIVDLEVLEVSGGCKSDWLVRTIFHNIRTLGTLPPVDDPLGVLSIDLSRDDDDIESDDYA